MNTANLIGRLTRDPELRYLQGTGTAMARFSIAVDRGMSKEKKQEAEAQGKQTADFLNIITWGKTAEFAANYLAKGLMVGVEGRIQSSSWTAEDGTKRYGTDINAERMHMIEWKNSNQDQGNQQNNSGDIPGFHAVDNQDIPF